MLFTVKASLMCSTYVYYVKVYEAQQICAGVSFWRWSRFNRNVISVQSLIPAINNISKENILIFHVDIQHVNKIHAVLLRCERSCNGNRLLNPFWYNMEMCLTHSIQQILRNHIQTSSSYLHKWEIKSSEVNCLRATFFITISVERNGKHVKVVTFILMALMLVLVHV